MRLLTIALLLLSLTLLPESAFGQGRLRGLLQLRGCRGSSGGYGLFSGRRYAGYRSQRYGGYGNSGYSSDSDYSSSEYAESGGADYGEADAAGYSEDLASADAGEDAGAFQLEIPLGLPRMRVPKDNPLTAEKIELGKQLFFDPRLSRDNTISCASCHDPKKGWSNDERFATGIGGQVGGRSAPTIINAAYGYYQFWDGRAQHVEGQALGPIQNPIEMDLTLDELEDKLNQIEGYRPRFRKVFGTDVTSEGIAKAIGAFERTVLSGNAPYDRYRAGDESALSEAAKRGMDVFFNKGHCSACHAGSNYTDGGFHNLGVGINAEEPDLGRFSETQLEGDRGGFKTPTLREIARTAPYMHDGSLATLEDVIDFYAKGANPNPQLDEELPKLMLTDQEKADLITFLKEGLSSPDYPDIEPPELPE